MARIVIQYDNKGVELHPATTVDAIVDIQNDGSAIRLDEILNAIIQGVGESQGVRNYAFGTRSPFTVSGFASASNVCVNTYKISKDVTGGDVCLAFDIELIGCTFTSNSTINLQGDYNWDYNAGVIGGGKISAKNGKTHVFAIGNIPTKTKDNYIQIRLDYVKGGTIKISNFVYAKGNKEIDWIPAIEDGFKETITYDLAKILALKSGATSAQIISAFTPIGKTGILLPRIDNHTLYDFKFEHKTNNGYNFGYTGSLLGINDNEVNTSILEICIGYYNGAMIITKVGLELNYGDNYLIDSITTKTIF